MRQVIRFCAILAALVIASCPIERIAIADVTIPAGTKQILNGEDFQRNSIYRLRDLYFADGSGNTMRLRAGEMSGDALSLTLPIADGSANQCLVTDGSGALSFMSKQAEDATLTALAGLNSTGGLVAQTAADTFTKRTLTAGSSKVSVSNGDGIAGNPTVDVTESNLTHDNIGGTLGIAKGGTGETTYDAAFDALAPTDTKGEIIVNNGTTNLALTVGTDGYALVADSAAAAGIKWAQAGGGSGEINVVTNPNDSTNWAASAGGIAVATTTTSTDLPLGGPIASAIKITPASGTDYVYYRWKMPEALKNRKLKSEWHQRPLSGYASGDLKFDVYKHSDTGTCTYSGGSYTRYSLRTDSSSVTSIPNITDRFSTTFDADSADCYELRFVRTAGTTALNITSVIVGPGIQPQGAVVGEWQSYTVTHTNLTAAGVTNKYRRVGSGGEFSIAFTASGEMGGTVTFKLPTTPSLTIDTSALPSTDTTSVVVGSATMYDSSTGNFYPGTVIYSSTTGVTVQVDTAPTNQLWKDGVPVVWAAGDKGSITFTVPIAEWAGSGTVNLAQNDVEYAYNTSTATTGSDTSSFGYGPAGVPFYSVTAAGNRRVQFQTTIQATDKIELEYLSGTTWLPLTMIDSNIDIGPMDVQNSVEYGLGISRVSGSSTQVDVRYGTYSWANGATFGATGKAWSAGPVSVSSRWRVKKSSGGQAVGFGEVNPGVSSGLVSANGLKGVSTNSSAPAGYVGEYKEVFGSNVPWAASGSWENAGSLTLSAGDWDVNGSVTWHGSGTTLSGGLLSFDAFITGTSSLTPTGYAYSATSVTSYLQNISGSGNLTVSTPTVRVRSDGTSLYIHSFTTTGQVVYLKVAAGNHTGTTPLYSYLMRARRMR
jgi:hypothetical protein